MVNGASLQLAPWKPYFEPAFAKLNTAVVWVQLHNLPVEFWDGESLESIAASMGRLLKIDDYTSSMSRSKFALICVEIDLSKPLKQGFWVGDDDHRVFVVVLYEKLPTFCYLCGMVGHGSNHCSRRSPVIQSSSQPPPVQVHSDLSGMEVGTEMEIMDDGMEARIDHQTLNPDNVCPEDDASNFGPWMLVARHKGRGGGRGGASGGAGRPAPREVHVRPTTSPNVSPNDHLQDDSANPTRGTSLFRGRGGHVGSRSRAAVTFPVLSESPPSELNSPGSRGIGALTGGSSLVSKHSDLSNPPDQGPSSSVVLSPKEKTLPSTLTLARPPILRCSEGVDSGDTTCPTNTSHAFVVAQVADALNPTPSQGSSDHSMSDSGEDDSDEEDGVSEMSEYDDTNEPDDSMTLDQYQSSIHKDALARRDPQPASPSNKKGRIGGGDDVI